MTCLVCLGGCSAEKNEYRQAGMLVRRSAAHIAAFAPFLRPPDRPPGGAAWRHGARTARTQIMNHAVAIYDLRPVSGAGSTPAERLGRGIEPVLRRCALEPADPPEAEIRRALDCQGAVAQAGVAFTREAERAVQLGLPRGTIPQLGPAAITEEASQAAAALAEKIQPSRAEVLRQQLWSDAKAEPATLRKACDEALRQARSKAPGVYEEIHVLCLALDVAERVLKASQDCGRGLLRSCAGRSQCALILTHARSRDTPAAYVVPLKEEVERCLVRLQEGRGVPVVDSVAEPAK